MTVAGVGPWGAYVITSGDALTVAREACGAGARILQYRDQHASRRDALPLALALREITRQAGALLVINDHVDLAVLVGADGVHLGQEDLSVPAARALGPRLLVGVSTHSLAQARAAEAAGADYIGIGPIFGTPTKPGYRPIGLEVLREVLAAVRIPAVAIGGIDAQRLSAVAAAGARTVAMVRGFAEQTAVRVREVNAALRP